MKKMILLLISFFTIVCSVQGLSNREVTFDDLSTKNFEKVMNGINHQEIKNICTYDFCDYAVGSSYKEILDNFVVNYFKTFDNQELKANLQIKGVKITKVVFQN